MASGEFEGLLEGKQVRCWSMRRDCRRLRREKKSSSGKVFEVSPLIELVDGDSAVAVIIVVVIVDITEDADAGRADDAL